MSHDKDGSGEIDVFEVKTAMHEAGYDVSDQFATELLEGYDLDKNGVLNFEEFLEYIYRFTDLH